MKNGVPPGVVAGILVATVFTQAPTTRLFFLDIRGGRVVSTAPDGSDVKILVSGRTGTPDGVAAVVKGDTLAGFVDGCGTVTCTLV